MKYADIHFPDIANGPGIRVSLFVSGCEHHCPECFNPETWDFDYGKEFNQQVLNYLMNKCEDPCDGLTILGGEPMHPRNQQTVLEVAKAYKERFPGKSLWIYTGYTLEEIMRPAFGIPDKMELLRYIDVLVDGRFILCKKNLRLRFRGSDNQRLIDMPKTLASGEIVLWDK